MLPCEKTLILFSPEIFLANYLCAKHAAFLKVLLFTDVRKEMFNGKLVLI